MRIGAVAWLAGACAAGLFAGSAAATDVNVIGLFPGKAVVVIGRGAPHTISVGQKTPEGVVLISATSEQAVLEVDGKRQTLSMGQHFETASETDSRGSVTLPADSRGQFYADGLVNGTHIRFMVDTGATTVLIPASEATRLGVDYRKGTPGRVQTANGSALAYRVLLDSVKVGNITAYNVEAVVAQAQGLDVALLGMSFLNRTEMRRDGAYMTLTKRY